MIIETQLLIRGFKHNQWEENGETFHEYIIGNGDVGIEISGPALVGITNGNGNYITVPNCTTIGDIDNLIRLFDIKINQQLKKTKLKKQLNPDGPAFATADNGTEHETAFEGQHGLTVRQYFAAMAMQGILNNGVMTPYTAKSFEPYTVALAAVEQADALIEELNK